MCEFAKKLCFALFLCSLHFSTCSTFDLSKLELLDNRDYDASSSTLSDYDDGNYGSFEDEHDQNHFGHGFLGLGIGNGIGICITIIIAVVCLACCCCCCCCCRSGKFKSTKNVIVAAPTEHMPKQNNNGLHRNYQMATVPTQTNGTTHGRNQTGDGSRVYSGSGNVHEQPPPSYYEVMAVE